MATETWIAIVALAASLVWNYAQWRCGQRVRRDICLQELYRRRFDVYTKLARLASEIGSIAAFGCGLLEERVGKEATNATKALGLLDLDAEARRNILRKLYGELNSAILIVEDSVAGKVYPLLEAISYLLGLEDGLEGDASMLSFTSEHRKAADKKVFSNAEALIEELQARLHIEQAAVDLRRLMECSFEVARQEVRGEAEFRE